MTKKILSFIMACVLLFTAGTNVCAAEEQGTSRIISFVTGNNENVAIVIESAEDSSTVKVYLNEKLWQKSVGVLSDKTIYTEIYDLEQNTMKKASEEIRTMNGFTSITSHKPYSTETYSSPGIAVPAASIFNEPVENTGLSLSAYGDGYYYLGSGSVSYAPNYSGDLYRRYDKTYSGDSHYWSWGAGETLSAISTYIDLFKGPVDAIISLLKFTGELILAYFTSVEVATYTFDYDYRVRVNGVISFETYRNITYWYINNITDGKKKWEQKRFNSGFSQNNSEMIRIAIDTYRS